MKSVLIILVLCLCFSCKDNSEKQQIPERNAEEASPNREGQNSTKEYHNENWDFSLRYPEGFQVMESQLPGNTPVINIYSEKTDFNPPFAIHEEPENAYIAVLPKGFGVDGPSGKQKSLAGWENNLPVGPALDNDKTKVYLLDSGQPWAFFLRFSNAPENWEKYGGIFVHFSIDNFKAECFNSKSGRKKPMNECEPMGLDEVRYTGKIQSSARQDIMAIVESFEFGSSGKPQISDLIQVEKPLPNLEVTSPLKVEGKARGYWFFEANAPIELLDKDYNKLAESYIEAKGEWMTENFVDFTGTIKFDNAPDDERGYLVFKRANPSDLRENDREYRVPVIFPPK